MFLEEERHTVPSPLYDSWPFLRQGPIRDIGLVRLFTDIPDESFGALDDTTKLDFCNARLQLRVHFSNAGWRGSWRSREMRPSAPFWAHGPPIAVPELSVLSSGTWIARTAYGAFVRYWDLIYILLTIVFCFVLGWTLRFAYTEDAPMYTGWRILNLETYDEDRLQLCTRSVACGSRIGHALTKTHRPLCFRLTVIYSRYVEGTIVFKRKYSEKIQYFDLSDITGSFDAAKFDSWISDVVQNAMTVPYGSVWNLWHLTLI
ncbi:hypothetical protein FS842_004788 [Serendipita sp. 407]|nr:hypothetical protein FRC16_005621 [Serendipita sp. 398]KAG8839957.1 hypothetical protein FRC20_005870 [Serendipita sp. 405]KAG9028259.1 hypothetical protein FS842_004788 [Serendipita sp. 407]